MRAFTQHAGAARQRVAGAEQERQCRDRFGAESIFAALHTLNESDRTLFMIDTQKKNIFKVCKWDVMYFKQLP